MTSERDSAGLTIATLRSRERRRALDAGINVRDVDLLLADLLQKTSAYLFAHGDEPITGDVELQLMQQLDRRHRGEPLQYIRGRTEFYGREFAVDSRVLIPRPETELLVEAVLARAPRFARVIDVGTGSGCIPISLVLERRDLEVTSVDRSLNALAVARTNVTALGARVNLTASDLLSSITGRFEVIVSNPPYIPRRDVATLETDVRDHEPHLALTPGELGTEIIERLLHEATERLMPRGVMLLEFGFGQEAEIRELAEAAGWTVDEVIPDLAAIPRIVVLSRHKSA
jgi:release factor glutamine methyltransferase